MAATGARSLLAVCMIDVAIVDTATQGITYADRLMTTVMALGVAPDGRVSAIGTEATNEIRFEPNLTSRFIRVRLGRFDQRRADEQEHRRSESAPRLRPDHDHT